MAGTPCAGVYPGFAPEQLPAVPGLEGMGVVEKLGAGASKFKEGEQHQAKSGAWVLPLAFFSLQSAQCQCCTRRSSLGLQKHLLAGQRVTAAPFNTKTGQGTWQQYACVPQERVLAVPDRVSDEAAAQFVVS
jgi:NADPH:quinone reductase-like Zn-dependent oxidoreductase